MFNKKILLGIGLTDEKEENILEYIVKSIGKSTEKYYMVTPNPEILVFASKHKDFKAILNNAKIALIDGMGLVWAGKILGKGIKHRIGGTDFMEKLCAAVSESNSAGAKKPITVGFLGGGPKIAERTAECLAGKYPELDVVYIGEEWSEAGFVLASQRGKTQNRTLNNAEKGFGVVPRTVQRSSAISIGILFVAFGFPKQEQWIAENLDKIPVKVAMGVGGAFDYISGNITRAPKIIRQLGFEWLYRLIRQPWRWKRQLALIEFGWLVLKEKIKE